MIQDDVYRHGLQGTIEGLRYWVPSISDVARVSENGGEDFWHLTVVPRVAGACPFELLLRHDQRYDMILSGQTYENLLVSDLETFLPLTEAIIEGHVVQRRWSSTRTGALVAIETLIFAPGASAWQAGVRPASGCESRDHHFLPYRR